MLQQLAENLWIRQYPLSVLGAQMGRTVTVIRLASGKVIVHSTAPYTAADESAIRALGEPGWLVEAMLMHDTYAKEGHAKFAEVPFLAPPDFPEMAKLPTKPLTPAPAEWSGEVEVIALQGIPRLQEHVMLHKPTRTLIVADLVFIFPHATGWTKFFLRYLAGVKEYPTTTRVFASAVKDKAAFRASVEQVLAWDFDRVIPGHGEVIETGGKAALRTAMTEAGLL